VRGGYLAPATCGEPARRATRRPLAAPARADNGGTSGTLLGD